ncbi:hypothetical protein JW758_00860 [Candidatus Peregrinibacteria bacterium]|nr:hypothetical protein [Candidatus Peregrinibacteria bacterium]
MKKTLRFIILAILMILLIAPAAFAKSEYPLTIKKADVFTKTLNRGIEAEVKVCSTNPFRTKFEMVVENTTVNAEYKRRLLRIDQGCKTYTLKFNPNFSEIASAGDEMEIRLINIRNDKGTEFFNDSKTYTTIVEDNGTADNLVGGDDTYAVNVADFVTHEPSNLRFKVKSYDKKFIDLLVTGVRWGGVKKVRIYEGRNKKIISANGKRVEVTLVGRAEGGGAMIMIETM